MLGHNCNFISFKFSKFIRNGLKRTFVLVYFLLYVQAYAQVGINTANPQQALHLAGATGTLRIESLNHINNDFNGGDVDGDSDLTNNLFPLYVDDKGDFTLQFSPNNESGYDDAIVFDLNSSTIELLTIDLNGYEQSKIQVFEITTSRESYLEVKYNLSFNIYLNNTHAIIADNMARRVYTHIEVEGDFNDDGDYSDYQPTREYAPSGRSYASGLNTSVSGIFYNFSKSYIYLPQAGSYRIELWGGVASDKNVDGGVDNSLSTYVEFATGLDFIFFRLH